MIRSDTEIKAVATADFDAQTAADKSAISGSDTTTFIVAANTYACIHTIRLQKQKVAYTRI